MIRVAHVLWSAGIGGIERVVLDLVREQARDPAIAPMVLFGTSRGGLLPTFMETGVPVKSVNLRSGYDVSPRKIAEVRKGLLAVDIIHAHSFVLPLALAMPWRSRPVIFTEHGNFGCGRRQTVADRVKRQLFDVFLRRGVAHVTLNSAHTERMWAQRGLLGIVPHSVVPNGVVMPAGGGSALPAARDLSAWKGNSFLVGAVSRLASVKRHDRLIEAFAAFQVGRQAKLVLVGDGPLRPALERQVAALGIADCVRFTGFRLDVWACQAAIDVSVVPSEAESFGLACLESLALGKPTIVFSDGGYMPDLIRPLCPEDVVPDGAHLQQRLAHYLHNAGRDEAEISRRIAYAARFDIGRTATAFRQLYEVLAPSSP